MTYRDWIENEARLIHADGCTGVSNVNGWACLEHDVQFWHGRSAVDAYRQWSRGNTRAYWAHSRQITFEEANQHFKSSLFRESVLGHLNPMTWWRYRAMKLKATRAAWDRHRAREAREASHGA